MNRSILFVSLFFVASLGGCETEQSSSLPDAPAQTPAAPNHEHDAVAAERDKLAPADRALVEAQEWCAVQTEQRLGSMGAPIKLEIQGVPVFLCCRGCQGRAERNPEATLATVRELKDKVIAERANARDPK